jgi:parallel beta-helix repeat protein
MKVFYCLFVSLLLLTTSCAPFLAQQEFGTADAGVAATDSTPNADVSGADASGTQPERVGTSSDYGPIANPVIPVRAIIINPGSDIQTIISSSAPGSVFLIKRGVYRQQTLKLKENDVLIGEYGAVLNGAKVVGSFTKEESYWVASGQTDEGKVTDFACSEKESKICNFPEQLILANTLLEQVASLGELAPGKWYFDYGADKIYMADDPTGKTVELSVTDKAVEGAKGAEIRNLIIEKYAPNVDQAVVKTQVDMVVEANDISLNGGIGLSLKDNVVARKNKLSYNGQYGVTSVKSANLVLEENEIAFNNTKRFNHNYNGGGTKFVRTRGLTIQGNYVHHNYGTGLWTDFDNVDVLYDGNTISNNTDNGILHEISDRATISNNTVEENGKHGIYISSSANVIITRNTLKWNKSGLVARTNCRNNDTVKYRVENVEFYNNIVYQRGNDEDWPWGKAASLSIAQKCDAWTNDYIRDYFNSKGNTFYFNTYYLSDGANFVWNNQEMDYTVWKASGQDWDGTFNLE